MPFRFQIVRDKKKVRIPLAEGEWIVGSAPDADVRIVHPTVSRRHARLFVTVHGVQVEDLDSSNGTRIDGESVVSRGVVPPGTTVLFGTAAAVLESLEALDSEVGITFGIDGGRPRKAGTMQSSAAMTTLAPSVLEQFTREVLPEVLGVLAEGASPLRRVQTIGHGLLTSLPCRRVEICEGSGDDEAVVFSAERESRRKGPVQDVPVAVASGSRIIRVIFTGDTLARAYEPLVRSCALLAGLNVCGTEAPAAVCRRKPSRPGLPVPATVSLAVQKIYSDAARVAIGSISVLILGESGTGKELLARYIHASSRRANAPLVTLNCAALSRDLLEAELFGVDKGVATGVDSRPGRFEQAHGGTLFLDEIGDMASETQAKILRVLQEKEVYRLGSGSPRAADVRVVSATNRNIDSLVQAGTFRSDLFHRIADWVVEVPALRRRREDIANLAVHFLTAACGEVGVVPCGISKAALNALQSASWPGNIRQLEREMSRAALFLEDGDILDTSCLQPALCGTSEAQETVKSLKAELEDTEKAAIERALNAVSGNVPLAADRLGVGRSTLYRRMAALGIGD